MPVSALRALRTLDLRHLIGAGYLGLLAMTLHFGGGRNSRWCVVALAVLACFGWAAAMRRARAMEEIATSRIGSAAQGYVEVTGRASVDADNLILSPLGGLSCIWYRYRVYSKDNSKREWRQVDSGTSSATFEINDGSGTCRVDPDYAEVVAPEVRTTYRDDEKYVEELLFAGSALYVLGEFSTIGGVNSVLNVREDVSDLLATWKQDPVALKRRFDINGDGEVDLQEWELARRLATKTVEQRHREIRLQPGIHMLRAPQDGRLFLISSLPSQTLRRRFVLWSFFHLAVCLAAAATATMAVF
jgi:hypothetical protein